MALVLDTDALPTIPPTWTAPTSCFASTLYYRVFYNGNFFSNLYGTPTPVFDGNTPIGACIPPSFMINVPFRTDGGCPTGYTTACTSTGASRSGKQLTTVTCCPSVTGGDFSFMCKDHQYGCHATATVGAVWTGAITNLANSNFESVTRTPSTEEGLEAWGIKMISIPTTTNATSGNSSSSEGISTGAIAGIAIGAAAVIAIALAAVLIYLMRRNRGATNNDHSNNPNNSYETTGWNSVAHSPNKQNDIYAYQDGGFDGTVHEAPVPVINGRVHEAPTRGARRQAWELQG
ncbi:hypothetical protein MCOR02_006620 [Pyricularia oryzae]|nr:hypothetical protein MCOR02_006620 [Pyricularia oryzae]